MVGQLPDVEFLPIQTLGLPWYKRFAVWRRESRRVRYKMDYTLELSEKTIELLGLAEATNITIPRTFITDGSSWPKILRWIDQPMGIGFVPGSFHDFAYRHRCLMSGNLVIREGMSRQEADLWYRALNLQVNGMRTLAGITWSGLRAMGWVAWRRWRARDEYSARELERYTKPGN